MTLSQHKQELCKLHNKLFAPFGIAILLKRREENEVMDKLNLSRFSTEELEKMKEGTMSLRHIVYKDYCQITPFSYD